MKSAVLELERDGITAFVQGEIEEMAEVHWGFFQNGII